MLIVVARFIPGGRTAVTLTCGITHYRYARFAAFDAVAALIWAVYGALLGYLGRPILSSRVFGGPRTRKATVWAETQLRRRGGMLIVVARFIPGGRTAVTLTCGVTRYRYARFAMFDAVAALIWAVYGALLGYLGGRMFQDKAWAALLVAFGIAGSITLATEAWQRWRAT